MGQKVEGIPQVWIHSTSKGLKVAAIAWHENSHSLVLACSTYQSGRTKSTINRAFLGILRGKAARILMYMYIDWKMKMVALGQKLESWTMPISSKDSHLPLWFHFLLFPLFSSPIPSTQLYLWAPYSHPKLTISRVSKAEELSWQGLSFSTLEAELSTVWFMESRIEQKHGQTNHIPHFSSWTLTWSYFFSMGFATDMYLQDLLNQQPWESKPQKLIMNCTPSIHWILD